MPRVDRALGALLATGVGALAARSRRWGGVVVLAYHRIGDPDGAAGDPGVWSATEDEFDAQLAWLAQRFELIAPSEVADAIADHRGRYAAITFDDGYRDALTAATPVLRSRGVRAGFYLCPGLIDSGEPGWWDEIAALVRTATAARVPTGPGIPAALPLDGEDARRAATASLLATYKRLPGPEAEAMLDHLRETLNGERPAGEWLTWEMVRRLRDAGMEIGAHTDTHPVLSRHPAAVQEAEIAGSVARLESEIGEPVRTFSYPVGLPDSFDEHSRAAVERAGIEVAFSCYGGITRRSQWDRLDVRRVPIGLGTSARSYRRRVTAPRLAVAA